MARWQDRDHLVLDSARVLYANGGIIGLSESGEICGGYDHMLEDDQRLTSDECVEIAQHMINRWERFMLEWRYRRS